MHAFGVQCSAVTKVQTNTNKMENPHCTNPYIIRKLKNVFFSIYIAVINNQTSIGRGSEVKNTRP